VRDCKSCREPINKWHALLTVTDGADAGDYHVGCFNEMTRHRARGQWNIVIHNDGEWPSQR
jgi:hypothetical protein